MEIGDSASKKVLLQLLKDFLTTHTITSLGKKLNFTRVGMWKILKKLASENLVILNPVGKGKTSTSIATLNWNNLLVEKTLEVYLTEEALNQRRWRTTFSKLEDHVEFLIIFGSILHSPKQANDIDLISIAKKGKFVQIQKIIDAIQLTQSKKIHSLSFADQEFRQELEKQNKAFLEAVLNGTVIFGQEAFVSFIKKMQQ